MIFATVQSPEKYDIVYNGTQMGLYTSYFNNPDLFNLITRTSILCFQFEPLSSVKEVFIVQLTPEDEGTYRETLEQSVAGMTVARLGRNLDPIFMAELFNDHKEEVAKLALTKSIARKFSEQGALQWVLDIVYARALQWKKYCKTAPIDKNQKVVHLNFGTNLTPKEEKFVRDKNPYRADPCIA